MGFEMAKMREGSFLSTAAGGGGGLSVWRRHRRSSHTSCGPLSEISSKMKTVETMNENDRSASLAHAEI